ncbi:MAG: EAL domain-containing protein [Legionella sp.]|jgi:diguanylate cyclase (GGDEF)-like protein/PAS domain S-box-containing protein|nr:EAL domain-containing protein [Legionella sp.]
MKQCTDVFKSIFIHHIHPMIIFNHLGLVQEYNLAAEQFFQYTRSEILGKSIKKLILDVALKKTDAFRMNQETKAQKKDGEALDVLLSVIEIESGEYIFYTAIFDTTMQQMQKLTNKSMIKKDSLTRLFNRQFIQQKLSEVIEKHRRNKTCFYLLALDLNQFKFINHQYGTRVGDELLVSFSKRVSSFLEPTDFFARIGGDEFLILLGATSNSRQFTNLVSCLEGVGKKTYELQGKEIVCNLTMGVVCYPSGGKTKEDLLSHVAFALYDAKRKKEPICFFSKKSKQYFEQVMKLESEVKHALTKKEFCMLYQPQVDMMTGHVVGVEALIRWNHPTRGLLSPDEFISYLEDWNLSEQLNTYVINKVLEDISLLNPENPLKVTINVSPKVVDFKQHVAHLVSLVQSKDANLHDRNLQLEFEITESSFSMQNASDLNMALLQAKKEGIQCAMDDFGTEFSSINRLTQYQFDTVKIDKVFTQLLDKRSKKSAIAIIHALIQLSKDLKFTLIAEGPETEAQVNALIDIGCVYGQGYYFYKPMLITNVRQLIKRKKSS